MITSRDITIEDRALLIDSLLVDEYHKDTTADFFYESETVCSVFEENGKPVLFVRGKCVEGFIALDIQFLDNNDAKCNVRTMISGFPILEERARVNGFRGFIFISQAPFLRKFCVKRLGFSEWDENLLFKFIQEVDKCQSTI
jgi:hypothetical protein